jgi:hypothetical protein
MRLQAAAALTALALSATAVPAAALEAKEGLVRLVVNETSARVSLYRLIDVAKNRYESLLFDQDPRTSFMTLNVDGRTVKLGDSSDYRFSVSRTDQGAVIEFKSAACAVRQTVAFAKSAGSALADGVRVSIEIENLSERDSSVGLRYLLDTWLGEKSGAHFSTDQRPRVVEETAIPSDAPDAWISSPGDKASFMVELSSKDRQKPDRVVLANWKRLSDAPWSFEPNPQRNFTLIPYSINDSAMSLYWEPAVLPRGGVRKLGFAMGTFSEGGYPEGVVKTATEEIFASTVLGAAPPDAATSLGADLVAVRDLIQGIDRAIAAGGEILPQEIAAWKKILDRLEERKKGY